MRYFIMSRVCIFLADGFEEVEALTVVDLLRRAEIKIDMVSISDTLLVRGRSNIGLLILCGMMRDRSSRIC